MQDTRHKTQDTKHKTQYTRHKTRVKIKRIKIEEIKEGYNRIISILVEKLGENG